MNAIYCRENIKRGFIDHIWSLVYERNLLQGEY